MNKLVVFSIKIIPFIIIFPFVYFFDLAFRNPVKSEQIPATLAISSFDTPIITNNNSNLDLYTSFDATIERFVRKWDLAGTSIAIARNGKLVYAKGFGYANKETEEKMQPYHMLRIASVSKLITAVAIMKLVENGQINLNQKVFGKKGILNEPIYLEYLDPRIEDITVKHLLNHSAGWTTRWGDHLFMHQSIARQTEKELPISNDDIICFALSKRLHFNPGSRSSYNNLGFTILEKIIERKTCRSYENYVQENIFKPLGINDAFIANNFDTLRYPQEVRYYEVPEAELVPAYNGQQVMLLKSRGGNDIRYLGAAGGWVISSVSLIKFLLDIDSDNPNGITLLQRYSKVLEQVEPGKHPLGWRWISSNGDKWRTGSFAGTSALAINRKDGFTYVFLTNCSPWVGSKFPYEVNKMMTIAIQRVDQWPDFDLLDPSSVYKRINLPFMANFFSPPKKNKELLTVKESLTSYCKGENREVYYF